MFITFSAQIKADMVSHTSDHFADFEKYAVGMIKKGEAYMDDTPQVSRSSMVQLFLEILFYLCFPVATQPVGEKLPRLKENLRSMV